MFFFSVNSAQNLPGSKPAGVNYKQRPEQIRLKTYLAYVGNELFYYMLPLSM